MSSVRASEDGLGLAAALALDQILVAFDHPSKKVASAAVLALVRLRWAFKSEPRLSDRYLLAALHRLIQAVDVHASDAAVCEASEQVTFLYHQIFYFPIICRNARLPLLRTV